MDHRKLISVVSHCPPLWDRSHDKFRDQTFKANLWNKIGLEINSTGPACREAFKALREKYIREREKLQHQGNNYRTWELLEYLQFLDPHIITRKSNGCLQQQQDIFGSAIKQDPTTDQDEHLLDESDSNCNSVDTYVFDFCKSLIKLVREARALWDRHSKDYHDKPLRDRLWSSIARTLNSDVNACSLRWKGLREKYIRQKQKFSEGASGKWEFLDELSFLDSVIQYRKKHWQVEESSQMFATNDNSLSQVNSDFEGLDEHTNDSTPNNQPSSSTNTYQQQLQDNAFNNSNNNNNSSNNYFSNVTTKPHTPDSTLDVSSMRKRVASVAEEVNSPKKDKLDNQERTPEQIFGELVAAMLATKNDDEKKLAMMEIMSVLVRSSS